MKKIFTGLLIMLTVVSALSAGGLQEDNTAYGQGSGQGLRDGSGAGRGNGTGRGNGGGYGAGQGRSTAGGYYRDNFAEDLAALYNGEVGGGVLTDTEEEGLLLMAEEEKLAMDVYNRLYEEWEIPVFRNIAESEQQHMDSVLYLLDAYDIAAPAEAAAGKFVNLELQSIYDELVKQGLKSVEDALNVGATVEDLDIADLQRLIEGSSNTEVKLLYQNLMKGSRNHMRSFTAQLDRYGESYEPQYITDDYYKTIMKYNQETAPIADPDYTI